MNDAERVSRKDLTKETIDVNDEQRDEDDERGISIEINNRGVKLSGSESKGAERVDAYP